MFVLLSFSFYTPQIIQLQYKTIQLFILSPVNRNKSLHSNELAQLTGKTDRHELANHKKVAQFLPGDRLPRAAKVLRLLRTAKALRLLRAAKALRLLRRCENLFGNSQNAPELGS